MIGAFRRFGWRAIYLRTYPCPFRLYLELCSLLFSAVVDKTLHSLKPICSCSLRKLALSKGWLSCRPPSNLRWPSITSNARSLTPRSVALCNLFRKCSRTEAHCCLPERDCELFFG